MTTPIKILIIRFSSIGDIVLTTPLLRVLRNRLPEAEIDFVVRKEYAELVRYNRNINSLHEFDASTGFLGLMKLKKQIRRKSYNLVIDIHNNLRSRYLRSFIGAEKIVTINKRIIARTLLVKLKKNLFSNIVSVAERYIETVNFLGIQNDNKGLEFFIPDDARFEAMSKIMALDIINRKDLIGFCPSAKHITKCWLEDNFAELGSLLVKELNVKIVLFGSKDDKLRCEYIAEKINASTRANSAVDLSGRLTLLETASVMENCNIIISNDTGLMHIASSLGKKLVAIFGSTVREFGFFPVGKNNIVIEKAGLYCRPCSHIGRAKCPEKHFRCMKEIRVEDVFQSVKVLLEKV